MSLKYFVLILVAFQGITLFLSLSNRIYAQNEEAYVNNEVLVQFTPEGEATLAELYREQIGPGQDESFWDFLSHSLSSLNPFRKSRLKTPSGIGYKTLSDEIQIRSIDPDPTSIDISNAPTIKLGTSDLPPHLAQYDNRTFKIEFETGTVEEAVTRFKQLDFVKHAQPNFVYKPIAIPNDTAYPRQWTHQISHAEDAWDVTTGSKSIVIAVLDSGVNYNHEDLKDNMWTGQVGGGTVYGWDFYDNDSDPMEDIDAVDTLGHGTMVSGIAGAIGNNSIGVAGVNWNVKIMAVRIGGMLFDSYAIENGTKFAADNGANVINMSFIGESICRVDVATEGDKVVTDSISYATRVHNTLVVTGAANEPINSACMSPANHPDILHVTSVGSDDQHVYWSGYGPLSWKDTKIISAPSGNVGSNECFDTNCPLTTAVDGNYIAISGNSFASPYVAGAAALILSEKDMSPFEVRKLLVDTADDIPGTDIVTTPEFSGDDGNSSYGKRLNLARAIESLASDEPTSTPTPPPTPTATPTESPDSLPTPTTSIGGPDDSTLDGKTQQVDWVFGGIGRCWSAWAEDSCSLTSHEGGAYDSLRDLNSDGVVDITCSQGDGSGRSTTLTNVSGSDIVISCERYACTSCASGDGAYARCDQSIESSATKVSNAITIPAGCSTSCSLSGASGGCIKTEEPTSTPVPTPTPTPDRDVVDPTPTPIPTLPPASSRSELPVMISAYNYQPGYGSDSVPIYAYGWFTDRSVEGMSESAKASQLQSQIQQMKSMDAIKLMMTSSYATTQWMLENYAQDLKDAGITIIGYDMELSVGTPSTEINTMHTASDQNSVVRLVNLAKQYGFKVIWGPIRLNSILAGKESQRAEAVRLMKEAGLTGVAFQEQQFIESQTAEARRDAVIADVTAYKAITGDNFEIYVQVMSSRCGSQPWSNCMQFLDYIAPHITGVAIWASGGSDTENLPAFINAIRGS